MVVGKEKKVIVDRQASYHSSVFINENKTAEDAAVVRFSYAGFLEFYAEHPFLFVGHRRSSVSDPAHADNSIK